MKKFFNNRGVSIIEILTVVVIVAILAIIASPIYGDDEWNDFALFHDWAMENGYRNGLS